MFALSDRDLASSIFGCSDGPASFNALATKGHCRVVSGDPLYQFSAEEIRARIEQTAGTVAEQTRLNADEFVWTHFRSVDELVAARMKAMTTFLDDFPQSIVDGRYVAASLPKLPFPAYPLPTNSRKAATRCFESCTMPAGRRPDRWLLQKRGEKAEG
jgi:hypothetical protein